jgi:hypothetical protein
LLFILIFLTQLYICYFNQVEGAGHPITHTCKCFSRCRPFTRS